MATPDIEIIRSTRRRRSVQAQYVNGRIQVRVPACLSPQQEAEVVAQIVAKLRRTSPTGNAELETLAHKLNTELLEGKAKFRSIRWVTNQNTRWGSCSPATGDIRISHRLQDVPEYVLAAVIVHELVHTFIGGGHNAEFWAWANKAPQAERARGYLEAYQRHGRGSDT